MSPKSYLVVAIIGAILVIIFSPSFFFLIVEGGLPQTPIERKVYKVQNYTIESRRILFEKDMQRWNESLPIDTVGTEFKVSGDLTSNTSLTFMLFDRTNFQSYIAGRNYSTIYRTGMEPDVTKQFSVELNQGSTYNLELVFLKTQPKSCDLNMQLKASYSIETTEVKYTPDYLKGLLFPSLFAVGLVLIILSFINLRRVARSSTREYIPPEATY